MDVVVAYGNPLRGDDGVAWQVADRLRRQGTRVLVSHQLTPELALDLKDASRVVFVDAAAGGQPGRVACARVVGVPSASASGHQLSPEGVLAYARSLNGFAPQAFIVTIAGQDFRLGTQLTGSVLAAVEDAIGRIRDLLDEASGSRFPGSGESTFSERCAERASPV